ncbi:7173_t:CDS:2, partial [Dentiscutata erythropus]
IHTSPKYHQAFIDAYNYEVINTIIPPLDCITQWNSTFHMLNSAIRVKLALIKLKDRNQNFPDLLSEDKWEQAIHQYLYKPTISKNVRPLDWWKSNYHRFLNLSKMAKDFLAIPATSVSSEQIFSLAGRIIDNNHINLDPDTIEALICQGNWLTKKLIV